MINIGDNPELNKQEQETIDAMTASIIELIEPCVRQRLGQYMALVKKQLKENKNGN